MYTVPPPRAISPHFLPNWKVPSYAVEEVCLPDAWADCDRRLMPQMVSLFPCVSTEVLNGIRPDSFSIFTEKFVLHLEEELIPLFPLLTGVPDLPLSLTLQEALQYDVEANGRAPNIGMLKSNLLPGS